MLVKFLLFLEYNAKQMFARWEKGNLISFQSTLKSLNNNLLRCFPFSELAQNLHTNSTKYLQIAKIKKNSSNPDIIEETICKMFLLVRVYTKFWNLNFTLGKVGHFD